VRFLIAHAPVAADAGGVILPILHRASYTLRRIGGRWRMVSGTGEMVGGPDVIRLGPSAQAMFRDFRADAILDGRP